jgi:hypothetical protein
MESKMKFNIDDWKGLLSCLVDTFDTSIADDLFGNKKSGWVVGGEPIEQPKIHINEDNIIDGEFEEIDESDEEVKEKFNFIHHWGMHDAYNLKDGVTS